MSWKPEEEKKEKKEMQSECFGRFRSDATRSEERVRYSTFSLDNRYNVNLTPTKNLETNIINIHLLYITNYSK